jgi:hypothetical protein
VSLPSTPNRAIPYVIKEGDSGWPVYGLQRMLNGHGVKIASDGDFGPATEKKTKEAQKRLKLTQDGIAGPKTQASLCVELANETTIHGLPVGLSRSVMEGESGYFLGAVNWSVIGGVDCGVVQQRVLGPVFSPTIMMDAFDPNKSLVRSMHLLDERAETYFDRPGVVRRQDRLEYSIRLGLLAHNWPWAAQQLADGHPLSTTKEATWVPAGLKFPDGTPVHSYADWSQFYAMGGPHGEAKMTRYVRTWPK